MTKFRKSAGCNRRNSSATRSLLRPNARDPATLGCDERNSQNPGNPRGATGATAAQQQQLLRSFPNLRVRQMGRNTPRNSPPIRGRCGVAPLGAAIGLMTAADLSPLEHRRTAQASELEIYRNG
jgi:hypothetical protein